MKQGGQQQRQKQQTLAAPVEYAGVALHCGRQTRVTILPAGADTGIVWQRSDLPGSPPIPASVRWVADTRRSTTLGRAGIRVRTVEHVLAALAGLGVDNARIQVSGEEPPIGDGSAAVYVDLIVRAGLRELEAPRRVRRLLRPVWVRDGDCYLVALPGAELRITYTWVSDHPVLGNQFADLVIAPETFGREVAPARTVGWVEQAAALQREGLALGGSPEVAVVVSEREILTPLRFPNEVARHKVLDLVGDLSLVGPFAAHVLGVRSGHSLDLRLAQALEQALEDPGSGPVPERLEEGP